MDIMELPPGKIEEEITQILCSGTAIRIERIISSGQVSPPGFWYDQQEDEWVLLAQGEALLTFEDGEIRLAQGQCTTIPSGKRHRIDYTSTEPPCIWICVFGSFKQTTD